MTRLRLTTAIAAVLLAAIVLLGTTPASGHPAQLPPGGGLVDLLTQAVRTLLNNPVTSGFCS